MLRYAPLGATTPAAWVAAYKAVFSALAAPLPPQLHLLTAHAQAPGRILVRISHSFEAGEDAQLSAPASVDLATIFANVTFAACEETTLTASQPLATAPSVTYPTATAGKITLPILYPEPAGTGLTVTLSAMQIRTFMCSV